MELILGEAFRRTGEDPLSAEFLVTSDVKMTAVLPSSYPSTAPPLLACSVRSLTPALQEHVRSLWAGEEVLFQCFSYLRDAVAKEEEEGEEGGGKHATSGAHQGQEAARQSCDDAHTIAGKIIWLDHMRDRSRYEKHLMQFAEQQQVACRTLLSPASVSSSSAKRGLDCCGVHLIVVGEREGLKGFLRDLRSQKVDVDSSGKPCLERKATVLHEGVLSSSSSSSNSSSNSSIDGSISSTAGSPSAFSLLATLPSNFLSWVPGTYLSATAVSRTDAESIVTALCCHLAFLHT